MIFFGWLFFYGVMVFYIGAFLCWGWFLVGDGWGGFLGLVSVPFLLVS